MAKRRMFSLDIVDTDAFLDMPVSTQLLYFHLSMRADDDGFVSNPKKITRIVNCSDDDSKVLTTKKFIIPFDNGICVIKHWKIHNYIQKDRYKETLYTKEMAQLSTKSNNGYKLDTECIQNGDTGKVRLGKVSKGKDRVDTPLEITKQFFEEKGKHEIVDFFIGRLDEQTLTTELQKFILYWTEPNGSGTKQRWQLERTFDVKRRLTAWLQRNKEWSKNKGKDIIGM